MCAFVLGSMVAVTTEPTFAQGYCVSTKEISSLFFFHFFLLLFFFSFSHPSLLKTGKYPW